MNVLYRLDNAAHYLCSLFVCELLMTLLFFLDELCELASLHELHAQKYSLADLSYLIYI